MLEILKQKKNLIIVIGIIFVGAIYWFINRPANINEMNTDENMLKVAENTNDEENDEEEFIVVHVTGAVKNPGIVKLKEDSRIEDAIDAAGGLTEDSDISDVNLAYQLEDGVKIRIPTVDDKKSQKKTYISEDSGENVILGDEQLEENSSTSLVNINKATQTELETLPGIGPSIASKIIEYRESKGKFSKIEDIKNVTGIGESKFDNIKNLIKTK